VSARAGTTPLTAVTAAASIGPQRHVRSARPLMTQTLLSFFPLPIELLNNSHV
jgi:hypothetical protein